MVTGRRCAAWVAASLMLLACAPPTLDRGRIRSRAHADESEIEIEASPRTERPRRTTDDAGANANADASGPTDDDDDDDDATKPAPRPDVDCVAVLEEDDDCPKTAPRKLECSSSRAQADAVAAGCVKERPQRPDDEDVCCPRALPVIPRTPPPTVDAGSVDAG